MSSTIKETNVFTVPITKSQLIWRFTCRRSDCYSYHSQHFLHSLLGSLKLKYSYQHISARKILLFLLFLAKKVCLQYCGQKQLFQGSTKNTSIPSMSKPLLSKFQYQCHSYSKQKGLKELPLFFLFPLQVSSFCVCVCYDRYLYHRRHWSHPREESAGLGLEHLDLDVKINQIKMF